MSIVTSPVSWIGRQLRTVVGGAETSLRARFVALIALLSLVVVVVSAAILIRDVLRVHELTLATAQEGGEYFAFGGTIADVVNRNQLRRIHVERIDSEGSQENMRWLAGKRPGKAPVERIDLAIVQKDTPSSPPVRAIASLFPEVFHLIAAKSATIDGVEDLRGKRVAVMPNLLDEEGDPQAFFDQFIARYGMTRDHMDVTELDLLHACDGFDTAAVDAVFLAIAVGNESVRDILTSCAVELVPVEVNAIETWHPYAQKATIYKGAYRGYPPVPPEDVDSAAVEALLLTHEDVPKGIIYEVARILFEHRNELLRENPHAFTIKYPDAWENLGIPLHPGAKAFYDRDEPGFLVLYAEPLALLFSIAVLCVTGLWQLRLRHKERQKNRADSYNLEILALVERIRAIEDLETLEELRQQLFDIFRRVLEDLDEDRLSPESFQLFTFPCEVAVTAMRHREMILMSLPPKPTASKAQSAGEPSRPETDDA